MVPEMEGSWVWIEISLLMPAPENSLGLYGFRKRSAKVLNL
jgi:hypothetical protein